MKPVHRAEPRKNAWASGATVGALAMAALSGCGGGSSSTAPADMSALPPDLILADLKDTTYPAGPYAAEGAVNMGDVLPNFTFQGYWSPKETTGLSKTQPYGEVSFGMMHDSGARYAILNLTAFW